MKVASESDDARKADEEIGKSVEVLDGEKCPIS